SAGIGAAGIANHFGLKTLMIEKKDRNIGGDCLNFGCVPSKALIHVSRQFHAAKEAQQFGLESSGKADFQKVMDYVHQGQEVIREHEDAAFFRNLGMDVELGTASFVDEKTIEVNGKLFTAPKIILATGSKPRALTTKGIEKVEKCFNNEGLFWEMETLPDRLLVVGGGPIGCEMAQAFSRLGSKVCMVNRGERIVEKELPEFSEILTQRFEKEGIEVYNQANLLEFVDAQTALIEVENGERIELHFDAVLEAIGRTVRTEGMGFEKAGIEVKKGKIMVDDYFRTTNKRVFAIGDAAGREQFSHGAEKHNRDLAFNFVSPLKKKHDLKHFSWVTFTDPEVATFGYSTQKLKEKGIAFEAVEQSFEDDDRAITADYRYAKMVLYFSKPHILTRKVRILGGSMIAPHAGELIQELILAAQEGIDIGAIFNKIYPYPTMSRINQKAIVTKRKGGMSPLFLKLVKFLYTH
ncbi:MAG: NAD(P)/FAD-dependent oxidoreductase, partial [Chitinophagales bacterium]